MVDCSPTVCCTSSHKPRKNDECMCGCGYLNGGFQVAIAQCLLILGSFFSIGAVLDCSFVSLEDEVLEFPIGTAETPISKKFGFVTFEKLSGGQCYWYDSKGSPAVDQAEQYFDFLGSDFQFGRIFGIIACCGGILQFLYSVSFCCSSQIRRVRHFLFFLLSVILTMFQALTLIVFSGDFCKDHDCVFGRGAGFSCGACSCYFLAGIMYILMTDYPGPKYFRTYVEYRKKDANDDEEAHKVLEEPQKLVLPERDDVSNDSTSDEEMYYDDSIGDVYYDESVSGTIVTKNDDNLEYDEETAYSMPGVTSESTSDQQGDENLKTESENTLLKKDGEKHDDDEDLVSDWGNKEEEVVIEEEIPVDDPTTYSKMTDAVAGSTDDVIDPVFAKDEDEKPFPTPTTTTAALKQRFKDLVSDWENNEEEIEDEVGIEEEMPVDDATTPTKPPVEFTSPIQNNRPRDPEAPVSPAFAALRQRFE